MSGQRIAAPPRGGINAYFRARYEGAMSLNVGALERARERGELKQGVDVELEARFLLAVMDGARTPPSRPSGYESARRARPTSD